MGAVKVFRWLYILAVLAGPYITVSAVWTIADIFNGLMAIPNMVALICLSGIVARTTKDYFKRLNAGEVIEFPDKERKKAAAAVARDAGKAVLIDSNGEQVLAVSQTTPVTLIVKRARAFMGSVWSLLGSVKAVTGAKLAAVPVAASAGATPGGAGAGEARRPDA